MVVPAFGYSLGDFVAVGTIAWNVYKSCRAAPGSFSNISKEVLSLHAVLKEADETIFRSPLSTESQARLKIIGDGCQCVLGDLQALVDKYESLGTQSKRTWDRMKWGFEDINEIRSRLISNATILTVFISTSQKSVEQKLDKLISDFQQGKRAPSVVSLQTVDSLDPDDKEAWRTIRKELEDIGISVAAFDANKEFIFEKISNAVDAGEFQEQATSDTGESQEQATSDTGEFQEQAVSSPLGSMHVFDVLSSTLSSPNLGVQEANSTVISDMEPLKASKATTKPTWHHTSTQAEQASAGTSMAAEPHPRVVPTRVPRVAALITTLTRSKKRLTNAVQEDDVNRIKRLLTNPSRLIDRPALNIALQSTSAASSREAHALLIDAGAGINEGRDVSRPLTRAVSFGRQDIVAFLLDKGADVNYQSLSGGFYSSALRAAITQCDAAMITFLCQRGADVNAIQPVSSSSELSLYTREYPTGIHQASAKGSTSIVDLLINLGANFTDSQSGYGTPLSLAIYEGRLSTAQLLIDKGANVNEIPLPLEQDQRQFRSTIHIAIFRSTIHIAIFRSSPDMVELLLKSGAVTDWHEAYNCAEREHDGSLNIRIRNGTRVEDIRAFEEKRRHTHAVLKLIEEKKSQKSVIRN